MLLRSSRTLRWRVETGRSSRAAAKREGDIGRVSADMVGFVCFFVGKFVKEVEVIDVRLARYCVSW